MTGPKAPQKHCYWGSTLVREAEMVGMTLMQLKEVVWRMRLLVVVVDAVSNIW